MHLKKKVMSLLMAVILCILMAAPAVQASELSVGDVNRFLNESAKLGEGSKGNQVAVIPINHIDGPQAEDLFYAFVPFKYVSRKYIKYQVVFLSCTCRSADVNIWTMAYVELGLPSSGKLDDAEIKTLSFGLDSTGKIGAGVWGDSNPAPNGNTFEDFESDWIPYYTGKTYADIKDLSTIADIEDMDIDAWTGATVSPNNTLRMLQALYRYHATDPFFDDDEEAVALREVFEESSELEAAGAEGAEETDEALLDGELPAPVDTTKTYLANADDKEETICEEGNFGPTCSAITSDNLINYLNRDDVAYIDLREYEDYAKKHIKGFNVVPFLTLIYNADAAADETLPQLYGGDYTNPIPVYEESDEILEALFPKDRNLFIMCQGGGRAMQMLNILNARGWDMSKVYNIGGMGHYTGAEYLDVVTDVPEITLEATYSFEGLTRIEYEEEELGEPEEPKAATAEGETAEAATEAAEEAVATEEAATEVEAAEPAATEAAAAEAATAEEEAAEAAEAEATAEAATEAAATEAEAVEEEAAAVVTEAEAAVLEAEAAAEDELIAIESEAALAVAPAATIVASAEAEEPAEEDAEKAPAAEEAEAATATAAEETPTAKEAPAAEEAAEAEPEAETEEAPAAAEAEPEAETEEAPEAAEAAEEEAVAEEEAEPAEAEETASDLPAPVDTTKTYLANANDKTETPCEEGNFGPTCSAINSDNLTEYLNRGDVLYIDLRDYADYAKKHLLNFEVIPFFALIYNADAITDETLPQLYGGELTDPQPVYEESDEILEALFPKDKVLFLMCQSGGRVSQMMNILSARGWDMSKIYNIGGMGHYTGSDYRNLTIDTPEITIDATYGFEGLTRIEY